MKDDKFDDLFSGKVISPEKITTFEISLYIEDKKIMTTRKEIRNDVLGDHGEINQHCFTIKWRKI